MPAERFLQRTGGVDTSLSGTVTGGTVTQGGKLVARRDDGYIDPANFPNGFGKEIQTGTAAEALAAGDFVTFDVDGVRKASASTTGRPADGFVTAAVTQGGTASVFVAGQNNVLTGLTVGARYYLSATAPGGASTTVATGVGQKDQFLGVAANATTLIYERDDAVLIGA